MQNPSATSSVMAQPGPSSVAQRMPMPGPRPSSSQLPMGYNFAGPSSSSAAYSGVQYGPSASQRSSYQHSHPSNYDPQPGPSNASYNPLPAPSRAGPSNSSYDPRPGPSKSAYNPLTSPDASYGLNYDYYHQASSYQQSGGKMPKAAPLGMQACYTQLQQQNAMAAAFAARQQYGQQQPQQQQYIQYPQRANANFYPPQVPQTGYPGQQQQNQMYYAQQNQKMQTGAQTQAKTYQYPQMPMKMPIPAPQRSNAQIPLETIRPTIGLPQSGYVQPQVPGPGPSSSADAAWRQAQGMAYRSTRQASTHYDNEELVADVPFGTGSTDFDAYFDRPVTRSEFDNTVSSKQLPHPQIVQQVPARKEVDSPLLFPEGSIEAYCKNRAINPVVMCAAAKYPISELDTMQNPEVAPNVNLDPEVKERADSALGKFNLRALMKIFQAKPAPNDVRTAEENAAHFQTLTLLTPQTWCHIYYYEFGKKVGEVYKMLSHQFTIDGLCAPSEPTRVCIGAIGNPARDPVAVATRRQVGKGCTITHTSANIMIQSHCDLPIFVQSPIHAINNDDHPSTVYRLPPMGSMELFSHTFFASCVLDAKSRKSLNALYTIRQLCQIRMSFIKGWGSNYRRRTILDTPCWIEMQLPGSLAMLDYEIQRMEPNDTIHSNS